MGVRSALSERQDLTIVGEAGDLDVGPPPGRPVPTARRRRRDPRARAEPARQPAAAPGPAPTGQDAGAQPHRGRPAGRRGTARRCQRPAGQGHRGDPAGRRRALRRRWAQPDRLGPREAPGGQPCSPADVAARGRPAGGADASGTQDPGPHRPGDDQPADRRAPVPGREDGAQPRDPDAREARGGASYPGSPARGTPAPRQVARSTATRTDTGRAVQPRWSRSPSARVSDSTVSSLGRRRLLVAALQLRQQLGAVHGDRSRRVDADSDHVSAHLEDGDDDLVTDGDTLARAAAHDQHGDEATCRGTSPAGDVPQAATSGAASECAGSSSTTC